MLSLLVPYTSSVANVINIHDVINIHGVINIHKGIWFCSLSHDLNAAVLT